MQTLSNSQVYKNFINNRWIESSSNATIESYSPANKNEIVGYVQDSTEEDVNLAVQAANDAKKDWRRLGQVARGEFLYKVADILEENLDDIAVTMTKEMGKTLPEAKGETARGVAILRYYAGEGMRKEGDVIPSVDKEAIMLTKRSPLGVVGIITPWNFPVAIPIWKIAPALVYGNTVVFKPATEASVTAAKIIECFEKAGFPEGVLNFVTGRGSKVGQALIHHSFINGLSFTGSEKTGQMIAEVASRRGIKYQLEMGGKNPVIIAKDADIEQAVQAVISGAFRSTGQKCTATSRVIVEKEIYDLFKDKLIEETKKITIGDGLEEGTWMGPCASESQFKTITEYLEIGKREATLIYGGEVLKDNEYANGYYVTPTIFEDVEVNMRIFQEEIFGPVIALVKVNDINEAIEVANETKYGLSASIFTTNIGAMLEFIEEINAGLVRINAETAGVELQAPFGGMKASSFGTREQGESAKEFYTEIKTVFIKP